MRHSAFVHGCGQVEQPNAFSHEQLRRLQVVADVALAHLELDELLDQLLLRIRDVLEADTCAVLMLDRDRRELVARAAKGLEEEVEQGLRIPVGRGFAGRVAAGRRPVVLDDVDHAAVLNPLLREKGIKSMLGVPLLIQGDVIGVLHVGTLTPRRFTRDDTQLLQMVADRAALGIERARVHDELVRLDRLKTSFVAFAAHELRTPAATVHGLSRALLRLGDDHPEQAAELRASLFEQSERLTRLVEQLLDLSRLDADLVLPEPEAVAARETLAEIAAAAAPGHAREVSVEVDEDSLTVDRQALERVVGNLVANAFRHGAPPVRITVGHRNGTVRIAVEDSGQGVPPQFVPRLFEPFEQHDRSRHAGSGLGLAIARSYARAHGGDLAYEPREPCGSRFVFTLPRA